MRAAQIPRGMAVMDSNIDRNIQITTDGFEAYEPAVLEAFPGWSDYTKLIKDFGKTRKVR